MEKYIIGYLAFLNVCLVILLWLHQRLSRKYQKLINSERNSIEKILAHYKDNTVLLYCLSHILKEATIKEDYETAANCRDLIKDLKREK